MMRTDNPVLDAERWAAEQEEKVEHLLPNCQACGKVIRDEYCYQYDPDDIETCVCESCIDRALKGIRPGILRDYMADMISNYQVETPLREAE